MSESLGIFKKFKLPLFPRGEAATPPLHALSRSPFGCLLFRGGIIFSPILSDTRGTAPKSTPARHYLIQFAQRTAILTFSGERIRIIGSAMRAERVTSVRSALRFGGGARRVGSTDLPEGAELLDYGISSDTLLTDKFAADNPHVVTLARQRLADAKRVANLSTRCATLSLSLSPLFPPDLVLLSRIFSSCLQHKGYL